MEQLPNCVVVSTVSQAEDENEWKAVRNKGLGGSDIGAICGVSPFTSARQIYFNKTGQFDEAIKPGAAATERMHWGHLLEPVVADEFAAQTGKKLIELGATLAHKDFPWMRANIDRLIIDDDGKPCGILEVKTTSEYNAEEWENGEIPLTYMYQLQWYMHILDLKYGAFACLAGGNKYFSYEVFRDDALINNVLIPAATDFWNNNVLALKEPELQSSDTDYINNKYSAVEKNSEVQLSDDTSDELAKTVVECKKQIKELEGILDEAQNRLKEKLQDKEIGYTKSYTIKWSPRSSTRVDTDKLKTNFPDIYEQCKKVVAYRAMTIKGGDV